eukprot:2991929-Amphidinium_carterae.1
MEHSQLEYRRKTQTLTSAGNSAKRQLHCRPLSINLHCSAETRTSESAAEHPREERNNHQQNPHSINPTWNKLLGKQYVVNTFRGLGCGGWLIFSNFWETSTGSDANVPLTLMVSSDGPTVCPQGCEDPGVRSMPALKRKAMESVTE